MPTRGQYSHSAHAWTKGPENHCLNPATVRVSAQHRGTAGHHNCFSAYTNNIMDRRQLILFLYQKKRKTQGSVTVGISGKSPPCQLCHYALVNIIILWLCLVSEGPKRPAGCHNSRNGVVTNTAFHTRPPCRHSPNNERVEKLFLSEQGRRESAGHLGSCH